MAPRRLTMAQWRLTKLSWRLTIAPRRLTLAPWRLTTAPWRLTKAAWSHHGSIIHRFLVSDSVITKNYLDSGAATTDLPQRLKSTSNISYYVTLNGFMLFITWGLRKIQTKIQRDILKEYLSIDTTFDHC
jgi:hypothetical protein